MEESDSVEGGRVYLRGKNPPVVMGCNGGQVHGTLDTRPVQPLDLNLVHTWFIRVEVKTWKGQPVPLIRATKSTDPLNIIFLQVN